MAYLCNLAEHGLTKHAMWHAASSLLCCSNSTKRSLTVRSQPRWQADSPSSNQGALPGCHEALEELQQRLVVKHHVLTPLLMVMLPR